MSLTPTAVQESEPSIGQIHGVVRVVRDQDDPWPMRDVAVIRHIDEQFLQFLSLNPVVKDRDKLLQVDAGGILDEKFQLVLHCVHDAASFVCGCLAPTPPNWVLRTANW